MDGKELGGNFRGEGISGLTDLTRFLLKTVQVIRYHRGMVEQEKPDKISREIVHQGWEILIRHRYSFALLSSLNVFISFLCLIAGLLLAPFHF